MKFSLNLSNMSDLIDHVEKEPNELLWVCLQKGKKATKQEIKDEIKRLCDEIPEHSNFEICKIDVYEEQIKNLQKKIEILKFYRDVTEIDFDEEIEVSYTEFL
jgi:hypothetical protein